MAESVYRKPMIPDEVPAHEVLANGSTDSSDRRVSAAKRILESDNPPVKHLDLAIRNIEENAGYKFVDPGNEST